MECKIVSYTEAGTDVYEIDGETLCTEIWEGKDVVIYGLMGERRVMTIKECGDSSNRAEDAGLIAQIRHWSELETKRKNYICTALLCKSALLGGEF